MAKKPEHFDILGRPIDVNSIVSSDFGGYGLHVCKVTKLHPKQIRVFPIITTKLRFPEGKLVYGNQCTLLPEAEATMYVLKNVKT